MDVPGVPLAEVEVEPAGLLEVLLVEVLVEVLEEVLPEPAVELVPVVPGVVVLVLLVEVPDGEVAVVVEGLVGLVPGEGSHGIALFGVLVCGTGVAVLAGGVAVWGAGDAV